MVRPVRIHINHLSLMFWQIHACTSVPVSAALGIYNCGITRWSPLVRQGHDNSAIYSAHLIASWVENSKYRCLEVSNSE